VQSEVLIYKNLILLIGVLKICAFEKQVSQKGAQKAINFFLGNFKIFFGSVQNNFFV